VAKLRLKFQERVLREVTVTGGVVTIGRQPDNLLPIDNPAVSGHHAKIYRQDENYVVEDMESFNGTYLNDRHVDRAVLKDGDVVLVGKHSIEFHADSAAGGTGQSNNQDRSISWQAHLDKRYAPQLDHTMVLDTKRIRELLAREKSQSSVAVADPPGTVPTASGHVVRVRRHRKMGTLTVTAGRTNRSHYVLVSKLTVIGRSELASVRLRRWFAPHTAASIHLREDGYFLVPVAKNIKIRVNKSRVKGGQIELKAGDIVELAGVTAIFNYEG
jgi:hypothetical protein